MRSVTLIRYDEVGLKGKNRRFFEDRLRENLARALGLRPSAVQRERGRLFLHVPGGRPPGGLAQRALSRVFGIRSFSPSLRVPSELPRISEAVLRLAGEGIERGSATFAVEARRSEKSFPLTSPQLNVILGRAVQDLYPELAVDLDEPDLTLYLEVRASGAYVYDCVIAGPGGLPVGVSGRALLLLSGGIDSPVAGWMALKRGLELDAIHFHAPPYTGPQAVEKAISIARELAAWRGRRSRIYLASLTAAQQAIRRSVPERFWTLVLRRMMARVAEAVASREGQRALVVGDSLGQVASQTLENMAAVDRATSLPILRPLVGFDKAEIVQYARRIGTYRHSVQLFEDCCVLFSPRRPVTQARARALEDAERKLPWPALAAEAAAAVEVLSLESPVPVGQMSLPAVPEVAPATRESRTRAIRIPSSSSTLKR